MAERMNDKGKVKLNLSDIEIKVDWDANPKIITKFEIKTKGIENIKTHVDGKDATVFLDVKSGFLRQRFNCGPVSKLPTLDPKCIINENAELNKGIPKNAKFEVNIVGEEIANLFRRSPTIRTTDGEMLDLFWFNKDASLGETPWTIEPPEADSDPQTTISISSVIYDSFMDLKNSGSGIQYMIFIDAMRTTITHIGMSYLNDEDALDNEGFAPIIKWLHTVLKIDPPASQDLDEIQLWIKNCVDRALGYYKLSTHINKGLKEITGGDE